VLARRVNIIIARCPFNSIINVVESQTSDVRQKLGWTTSSMKKGKKTVTAKSAGEYISNYFLVVRELFIKIK
jgi:hypothetical protein